MESESSVWRVYVVYEYSLYSVSSIWRVHFATMSQGSSIRKVPRSSGKLLSASDNGVI